jgi:hypothetical protein
MTWTGKMAEFGRQKQEANSRRREQSTVALGRRQEHGPALLAEWQWLQHKEA